MEPPVPSQGAGALLSALIEAANAFSDASALLHEEVRLHRLDGTHVAGRDAVADAIQHHGTETVFRIVGRYAESIHVTIEIAGLEGHLLVTLSATTANGLLTEIWMD